MESLKDLNKFRRKIDTFREMLNDLENEADSVYGRIRSEIRREFVEEQERDVERISLAKELFRLDTSNNYAPFLKVVKQDLPYIPFGRIKISGYGIDYFGYITLHIEVKWLWKEFSFQKLYPPSDLKERLVFK